MINKVLLILLALLSMPISSMATPQVPDKLIYKGKMWSLFANPLESFYKGGKSRPKFQIEPRAGWSNNHRGYIATWEVKDSYLYLIEIDSWICEPPFSGNCMKVDLKELFGEKYQNGRVKADWFSGDLRMPEGKMLQYVHMGYVSLYERDTIVTVKSGEIMDENVIDNTTRPIPPIEELERQEVERMKKRGEWP